MTDDEFLAAFEAATLPAAHFDHRGHLRAAWACLRRDGLALGGARFDAALQCYAASLGATDKYDATVTARWLAAVDAARPAAFASFADFAVAHPALRPA